MNMIEIGARMKARRIYLEMSQMEVADACFKERSSYAQYESGKNEPGAETIALIAKKLRVPVGYLFGEMNEAEAMNEEVMQFYNGLAPTMRTVARNQLKALFDAQDQEAREIEPTTHGKRAE